MNQRVIIIFDLDDTLVNGKMKIPRQTYHMLNFFKKKHCVMGVISYNFMAKWVAHHTHLYKYTQYIFFENVDRDVLFEKCFHQMLQDLQDPQDIEKTNVVHYVDDRLDNLQIIKNRFGEQVSTHHCPNMYELHKLKKTIF